MSSEIRDRAREKLGQMDLHLTYDGYLSGKDIDQILSIKGLAVVDREAELPALTYEEYMAIHSAWANSKEAVENLLRRITLETCYKVRKEGWIKGVKE